MKAAGLCYSEERVRATGHLRLFAVSDREGTGEADNGPPQYPVRADERVRCALAPIRGTCLPIQGQSRPEFPCVNLDVWCPMKTVAPGGRNAGLCSTRNIGEVRPGGLVVVCRVGRMPTSAVRASGVPGAVGQVTAIGPTRMRGAAAQRQCLATPSMPGKRS